MPESRVSNVELKKVIDIHTPTKQAAHVDIILITEDGGEHGFALSTVIAKRLLRVIRYRLHPPRGRL